MTAVAPRVRPPTGAARVAGVVGAPIAQSLSPLIHRAWIDAAGLDAVYAPFAPAAEAFERFVEGLRGGAIRGLNVTAPFKTRALALSSSADPAARAADAANLLLFARDGAIEARNTDGIGLLDALGGSTPRALEGGVVVLGAGGAAAGAALSLSRAGAADLRFVARIPDRAEPMASRLGARVYAWDDLAAALEGASLVVNATTRGLDGHDPLELEWSARAPGVALDMVYRPLQTAFLQGARRAGWVGIDGLAMLIGQARPSFRAFFDVDPPALDVRALCLTAIGGGGGGG